MSEKMPSFSQQLADRTKAFALRIVRMNGALPKNAAAQVLGKQVLRSGISVGANYREARRSSSRAEFVAKITDCLQEMDETEYWLELLAESEMLPKAKLVPLQQECTELVALFASIAKSSKPQKEHRK